MALNPGCAGCWKDAASFYVLAVRSNLTLRFVTADGIVQTDPAELADDLDAGEWVSHEAGEGSKGIRLYDWARIALPWPDSRFSLTVS